MTYNVASVNVKSMTQYGDSNLLAPLKITKQSMSIFDHEEHECQSLWDQFQDVIP